MLVTQRDHVTDRCSSQDSVDCAVCKNTYHMTCVRPPLLKKPARGFGWSCGPCSRRQEKKLEARNTPNQAGEGEEEEVVDEEEEDHGVASQTGTGQDKQSKDIEEVRPKDRQALAEQIALSNMWPYRYLGIHCKVEDALDFDDRIYPRAASRLGPKHQANVHVWHGRPVKLVKPKEVKRRYNKSNAWKNVIKIPKDTSSEGDKREKRAKWIQDEPPGYVARGDDHSNDDPKNTAHLMFRLPQVGESPTRGGSESDVGNKLALEEREKLIDNYMVEAKRIAPQYDLPEWSTNFLDKALELFVANNYRKEEALNKLRTLKKRKDLKEPELSKEELRKFEEGVARYGSRLGDVSRHVGKSQKHGEIVRFYYMWKKTPNGRQIWDNFDGRKGKKQAKEADSKLLDDVADDIDDSAFDNEKAHARRRGFECKFCLIRQSPQWRRAPATQPGATVPADPSVKGSKDKNAHLMVALCQRCASLWRKYGIQWENIDEVAKKVASGGGKAWRRRVDEELLSELVNANQANQIGMNPKTVAAAATIGLEVPSNLTIQPGQEGGRKRQKLGEEPAPIIEAPAPEPEPPKRKEPEKPPEPPPLIPEEPRIRVLPCAVCYEFEPLGEQHLCCRYCRLTVHRNCYGVPDSKPKEKWTCDMCVNDAALQVSTTYECILCTVTSNTDTDVALLMDPPRVSHKKKTDREREKERLEKEMIDQRAAIYFKEQEAKGRPKTPRQPLKRTSGNNWVHVVCALFHSEIKFSSPETLEFAEGFGAIPAHKWTQRCKHCKIPHGACVNCSQCQAAIHVACAQQFGHNLVFDLNPVKQSRKDAVSTVGMAGEVGTAVAVVYCREHSPKHKTHRLNELDEGSPINALQKFVRSHKAADLQLTGTTRKALAVQTATKQAVLNMEATGTRSTVAAAGSAVNGNSTTPVASRSLRVSPSAVTVQSDEVDQEGDRVVKLSEIKCIDSLSKECIKCGTDATPKWHKVPASDALNQQNRAGRGDRAANHSHTLSNGMVNGDSYAPSARTDVKSPDGIDNDPDVIVIDKTGPGKDGGSRRCNDLTADQETDGRPNLDLSGDEPKYICHKCRYRKLKNPTPPREPSPPAPPPPAAPLESREPDIVSPPVETTWPSQPVHQPSPQEHYRRWSSGPTERPYHGPDYIPNGVAHSPGLPAPPPIAGPHPPPPPPPAPPAIYHQHVGPQYMPPPHPQHPPGPPPPHYGPPPHPPRPLYVYRDSRDRTYSYPRPAPVAYHMPVHNLSGYGEAQSFQYRRHPVTGALLQVPYNGQPSQSAPPPRPSIRSPPPAHRLHSPRASALSPPVRRLTPPAQYVQTPPIPDHGAQGPPEVDTNPFAYALASPSQPSARLPPHPPAPGYDSPRTAHTRPPATSAVGYDSPGSAPARPSTQNATAYVSPRPSAPPSGPSYESPRTDFTRPRTPEHRDARRSGERPNTNGASQSPSVGNLLG